jgi:lipopolysaccharide/colanic/teichoic acid biosynthesis glycosyltransferase
MKPRKQKLLILLLLHLLLFFAMNAAAWAAARDLRPADHGLLPLPILSCLFFFLYFAQMWVRVYSRDYFYYLRRNGSIMVRSVLYASLPAAGLYLLFGIGGAPRVAEVLLYLGASVASVLLAHGCQYAWITHLASLGYFRKNVMVVGDGNGHSLARASHWTKNLVGAVVRDDGTWVWRPAGKPDSQPVKGFPQIRSILLKESVGEIVLYDTPLVKKELLSDVLSYCQELSISHSVVPVATAAPPQRNLARLVCPSSPAPESFASPRDSLTAISLKRLTDLAVVILSLALLIPLGALIALAITLDDGGPVFYVSRRVGKGGRTIRFYKFRTMVRNADGEKARLLAFNARSDGPLFKMRNDPRVTRVGRVLRRYSLDELPQVLNVLLGSMSLVGPRPHLPEEVSHYRDSDFLRLECMPGIVGLPQVSGSSIMNFRQSVALDLAYRSEWSLGLDLQIIGRTLRLLFQQLFMERSSDHY